MANQNVTQLLQQTVTDPTSLFYAVTGGTTDTGLPLSVLSSYLIKAYPGFLQVGAGAVTRTIQAKAQDVVSVKDFGAVGNGIANDTSAIQAAINSLSSGGTVLFPNATYLISSTLTVGAGITLLGESQGNTTIISNNLTSGVVTFSQSNCALRNFKLGYAGTPTAGSCLLVSGSNFSADNFIIGNCFVGIEATSTAQFFTKFQVFSYVSIGIFVHDTNDIYFHQFILNAQNSTNGALGGIRLQNKAEAIVFTDGDILLGVYAITTDATTYGIGTRPAYCNFTDVYFDSATNTNALLNNIVESEFIGCWFSGGRTGGGFPGCTLNTTDSLVFTNTRFFNCGSHGCSVSANSVRSVFTACSFESNSVTAGSAVAHGLNIAANTTDFIVENCIAHNGLFTGTQGWGIIVQLGTSNRYSIQNNLTSGNVTGGVSDGGSGINKFVFNPDTQSTFNLPSTTASSSTTTGALTVGGGVGITGAVNTGSTLTSAGTITTSTGNFIGSGNGYSIGNTTGLSSGGLIQIYDATHGVQGVALLAGGVTKGTFTAAGFTPATTSGIVGTTLADNANAGSVGEVISSTVLAGSAVALTANTTTNVTSISLTAGDWDVWGTVATNPAGTTTQSNTQGSISMVSATFPTAPNGGAWALAPFTTTAAGTPVVLPVGLMRLNISTTTTVYLVIQSNFGTSTNAGYGFLGARRVR